MLALYEGYTEHRFLLGCSEIIIQFELVFIIYIWTDRSTVRITLSFLIAGICRPTVNSEYVTSQKKRTLMAFRFLTVISSQAISHPFRENLHLFERLGQSVQKGSQSVQSAVSSVHKNCLTVPTASAPVQKNLHPFKQIGHLFTKIIHLLKQPAPSVQKNCCLTWHNLL